VHIRGRLAHLGGGSGISSLARVTRDVLGWRRGSSPGRLRILCAAFLAALASGAALAGPDFKRWTEDLWPEAQAQGVSRTTFDIAFREVTPDLTLPDLILPGQTKPAGRDQPEFSKTPVQYLDPAQITRLAAQGGQLLTQNAQTLARIEREIGVSRHIVLAIWGRETAFGAHKSPHYAIRALATQAYLGRRKDLFRTELLHALKMLEDRVITPAAMKSSWAGAMGLTQFMPSEFYTTAVDLDGDGRKDIWQSLPDALGSAAMQLKQKGWVTGQPWAYEVKLPDGANCLLEGIPQGRPVRDWVKMGVAHIDGKPIDAGRMQDQACLIMPAGLRGPVFLAFENYLVIKRYNMSDLYVLFVGHLADRIAGGGEFRTPWASIKQLSNRDIEEIQERLKKLGHDIEKVDGRAGMNTRNQIGAYQKASRMPIDCWPSETVLNALRKVAAR
jgi:lytic murein transglycosylase